jgi:hypothetical protein
VITIAIGQILTAIETIEMTPDAGYCAALDETLAAVTCWLSGRPLLRSPDQFAGITIPALPCPLRFCFRVSSVERTQPKRSSSTASEFARATGWPGSRPRHNPEILGHRSKESSMLQIRKKEALIRKYPRTQQTNVNCCTFRQSIFVD